MHVSNVRAPSARRVMENIDLTFSRASRSPGDRSDPVTLEELNFLRRRYSALVIQLDNIRGMLDEIDPSQRPHGKYRWTIKETLGHLIDVDRDIWGPRIERILSEDSPHFESIDQAELVKKNEWNQKRLDEIIALLMKTRWALAIRLNGLSVEDFQRTATHYALGTIRLVDVLRELVDHDEHHFIQVKRLLNGY